MNLLVLEKAPQAVSKFMVGGILIALNKNKEGSPPDIRPIVVGESLRRLAGKCICASLKEKISSFSSHYSLEWPAGQGLRRLSIVYEIVLKSIGCRRRILSYLKWI